MLPSLPAPPPPVPLPLPPPLQLLALALLLTSAPTAGDPDARTRRSGARCPPDALALFRLSMHGHWTRAAFPKHFPEYRPAAHFSTLIGRTHDARAPMFRVGAAAGDALSAFAESGRGDALRGEGPRGAALDEFSAPALASGDGRTYTSFFADANHSMVSVVARLVPSPDWFVGLDSVELCPGGFWIQSYSVQVRPLDAGSDSGFTFTAPNWPSTPRQPVTRIGAHTPAHRAASFYYPHLARLPPIATFRIKLEKTLRVTAGDDELSNESNDVSPAPVFTHLSAGARSHPRNREHQSKGRRPEPRADSAPGTAPGTAAGTAAGTERECVVGSWGPWGPCRGACAAEARSGEAVRERSVLHPPAPGAAPCPPLRESRPCEDVRDCRDAPTAFFRW